MLQYYLNIKVFVFCVLGLKVLIYHPLGCFRGKMEKNEKWYHMKQFNKPHKISSAV